MVRRRCRRVRRDGALHAAGLLETQVGAERPPGAARRALARGQSLRVPEGLHGAVVLPQSRSRSAAAEPLHLLETHQPRRPSRCHRRADPRGLRGGQAVRTRRSRRWSCSTIPSTWGRRGRSRRACSSTRRRATPRGCARCSSARRRARPSRWRRPSSCDISRPRRVATPPTPMPRGWRPAGRASSSRPGPPRDRRPQPRRGDHAPVGVHHEQPRPIPAPTPPAPAPRRRPRASGRPRSRPSRDRWRERRCAAGKSTRRRGCFAPRARR